MRRRNPRKRKSANLSNTYVETWFERDRASVELRWKSNDKTIVEFWDEDVQEMIEDGFIDPTDFHRSTLEYAKSVGLV